jgi:uncharacterized protein
MTNNNFAFRAAWWLSGPHAQTIWPALLRIRPSIPERWERVELPDGDFVDCVWDERSFSQTRLPIVLILHGLEGGINSSYSKPLMNSLTGAGFRPVLMHFRSCSGVPNRLDRTYHSGDTEDLEFVVDRLKDEYPDVPLHAIGISIGANVLLKWLGKTKNLKLESAVAVSVPFLLGPIADRLMQGFSRVYQWYLLKSLKAKYKRKFAGRPCPFDIGKIDSLNNFWEFDDFITAPLHGFKDVHDYYDRSSCRQYLSGIKVPTLILHSKDDSFMTPEIIPSSEELSSSTQMIVTERGGHVGFIYGAIPGWPRYWLDSAIPSFEALNP